MLINSPARWLAGVILLDGGGGRLEKTMVSSQSSSDLRCDKMILQVPSAVFEAQQPAYFINNTLAAELQAEEIR